MRRAATRDRKADGGGLRCPDPQGVQGDAVLLPGYGVSLKALTIVILSAAKDLNRLRLLVTRAGRYAWCHPERSEGSDSPGTEILRCAQDDIVSW